VYYLHIQSRDSAVGIATGYGLDGRGGGVRIPVGARLSLLHVVQAVVWPIQSIPMDTGGTFPGVKAAGA
jgi:hypothetical protein